MTQGDPVHQKVPIFPGIPLDALTISPRVTISPIDYTNPLRCSRTNAVTRANPPA